MLVKFLKHDVKFKNSIFSIQLQLFQEIYA